MVIVWSPEEEDVGSPPLEGGINRVQPVGAHDYHDGDSVGGQRINAPYQGVHASSILVMHLGKVPALP